jgi:hypothetical protein
MGHAWRIPWPEEFDQRCGTIDFSEYGQMALHQAHV